MPSIEVKQKLKILAMRNPLLKYGFAWISALGFDPVKLIDALRGFPLVIKNYFVLKRLNKSTKNPWLLQMTMPCLEDKYASSGIASGHYFHQDILVARRIYARNPKKHVDVGSRIDGFVAHVATFRKIEVIDIRFLTSNVPNISFRQLDVMNSVNNIINYCDSLSCLHALEHFGLGRYGDPLDIQGHTRGFENISKILQHNGILYLSVPIGKQRIDFNAHRVFSIDTVLAMAKSQYDLISFSYVDDLGDLHENINLNGQERELNCGCYYGCGIFELRKLK